MPRISAFRGTFEPNRRPWVSLTPDVYVSLQGETTLIACGECKREVNINKYLTGASVDASVDSPPGSATFNLAIPDNDINDFFVDGQFVIIPMMEVEIFAKGYYTVGGFPQYYRIFWGMVSIVTKNWSNGVTSISIQCKDILRWWEVTNITLQSAFLSPEGSSSGWNLFQNQFAGANPYTVIIALAKESMGDFSVTTGSFTSFKPEKGAEQRVVGDFAKDIMTYWQLKFGNIWNNLVLYGSSGQAYTFTGNQATVSPVQISKAIFEQEASTFNLNKETSLFKIQPSEVAAFKIDISRAGDVDFFQTEQQTKLSVAITARDQAGYEFYCDTTGDIIFKPPFYNLNVIPNKPVSWIQDFEIIDDSVTDSEAEVFTHITSSGNAFGGVTDWGLNDDITTPRTGVMDWHLLKRYGWRHIAIQLEWAGNPRKLFFHLLDYMDRVNSKRNFGTVTIPMRPELRMGFPIWFPKWDSFYYVQGISHNFSPGGQATTTLTLTAKRSKFIAPKNIGKLEATGSKPVTYANQGGGGTVSRNEPTFKVDFPSDVGQTIGYEVEQEQEHANDPAVLRDPKTGKLLGFPNAVMVYRTTLDGEVLARVLEQSGSRKASRPQQQDKNQDVGSEYTYQKAVNDTLQKLQTSQRTKMIDRLRMYRYESGMTNAGLYDYAHDTSKLIKEFSVIPADHIFWGTGTNDPDKTTRGSETISDTKAREDSIKAQVTKLEAEEKPLIQAFNDAKKVADQTKADFNNAMKAKGKNAPPNNDLPPDLVQKKTLADQAATALQTASSNLNAKKAEISAAKANSGSVRRLASLPIMIRPVSDDFGFEVIGHYRYGRGAFIDRGKVQIPDPATKKVVNQLNIQFAPHGGLITDNPRVNALGPDQQTFAESFEKMQPEDYMTGASFQGANYGSKNVDPNTINPTLQQTYTDSINQSVTNTSKAVFAEADALRRSKTLAELKPTLPSHFGDAFNTCPCMLGRANWLTVLPQDLIQQVLSVSKVPVTSRTLQVDANGLAVQDDQGNTVFQTQTNNILVGQGGIIGQDGTQNVSNSFFDVLHDYLVKRFQQDYSENQQRETFAISGGRDVSIPDDTAYGTNANNILTPPGGALFDRAAQGDPQALAALQNSANFNFGQTQNAAQNLQNSITQTTQAATQSFENLGGSIFTDSGFVKKGPDGTLVPVVGPTAQVQPPNLPPTQVFGQILNRTDSLTTPKGFNNPPGGLNSPPDF